MSISPIPSWIQPSAMRWVRNTNTQSCTEMHLSVSGPTGAAVVLGVLVGWLLRKGKRAKGTCWHNTFTNNCLLLLAPQGKHFMEMTGDEGQRCEKATGKISFLDSPTMSLPALLYLCLWNVTLVAGITCMCLFALMHKIQVELKNKNFYTKL